MYAARPLPRIRPTAHVGVGDVEDAHRGGTSGGDVPADVLRTQSARQPCRGYGAREPCSRQLAAGVVKLPPRNAILV